MENGRVVDQKPHRALALIASQPLVFQRQGSVVATWRRYHGRRLGPYYRLAYRDRGRQCSVYLGRPGDLVERVRAALGQLQAPRRRMRTFARVRARIKASLCRAKAQLDGQLRKLGLYLKGFESRGWRQLAATGGKAPAEGAHATGFRFSGWSGISLGPLGCFAPLGLPAVGLAGLTNPHLVGRIAGSERRMVRLSPMVQGDQS